MKRLKLHNTKQLVEYWLIWLFLVLIGCSAAHAQPTPCTIDWLARHSTARETTGYNRGPEVDKIILAGGGNPYQKKSPEYCGFTQAAANRACGQPIPGNGLQGAARAWFTDMSGQRLLPRTRYYRGRRGSVDSIAVGQKAGYDWGIGHVQHINCVAALGRPVRPGRAPRSYWAWGGNEGKGRDAGMHYNPWPIGAVVALSDWSH